MENIRWLCTDCSYKKRNFFSLLKWIFIWLRYEKEKIKLLLNWKDIFVSLLNPIDRSIEEHKLPFQNVQLNELIWETLEAAFAFEMALVDSRNDPIEISSAPTGDKGLQGCNLMLAREYLIGYMVAKGKSRDVGQEWKGGFAACEGGGGGSAQWCLEVRPQLQYRLIRNVHSVYVYARAAYPDGGWLGWVDAWATP